MSLKFNLISRTHQYRLPWEADTLEDALVLLAKISLQEPALSQPSAETYQEAMAHPEEAPTSDYGRRPRPQASCVDLGGRRTIDTKA